MIELTSSNLLLLLNFTTSLKIFTMIAESFFRYSYPHTYIHKYSLIILKNWLFKRKIKLMDDKKLLKISNRVNKVINKNDEYRIKLNNCLVVDEKY